MVKLVNRAKMKVASGGAGTLTLGTACDGYQTFAAGGVADQDKLRYTITDGNDWEIGVGTYTASGTTLARAPTESSNSGNAITCGSGAEIFVTMAAEDFTSNALPRWTTTPTSELKMEAGVLATITGVAIDEAGFPIQYSWDGYSGSNIYSPSSLPAQISTAPTFDTSTKTWTLTPSTSTSDAGNFIFRSRASDGVNTLTANTAASLSFMYTTGLLGWYDADNYTSGASTWSDKSGNSGPSMTVATSGITYVSSSIGGLPTIDLTSAQAITTATNLGTGRTLIMICRQTAATSNSDLMCFGGSGTNGSNDAIFFSISANSGMSDGAARNGSGIATASSKLYKNNTTSDISSSVAGGGLSRKQFDVLVTDSALFSLAITDLDLSGGFGSGGGGSPFSAPQLKIRAIMIYDHEVSAANIEKVHDYYKAEYSADSDMAP